jgi:competence protein ComEC
MVTHLVGTVQLREVQGAQDRVRLTLLARLPEQDRAIRARINLDCADDLPAFAEGATIDLRARLMPPAPPMLPGSYDFARAAWFAGISATGSALGKPRLLKAAEGGGRLRAWRHALSDHVQSRLSGTPGAIAMAFASGDRGEIAKAAEEAMRDAGLTHLLSISGLHVSAVVAAGYALAIRLLALWPWLALRVRLPVVAAAFGAGGGIAYTLLTGAEVPTIRSCIGAVLVLGALALGRDPLSMRMVAIAALFVMLLWPEAVLGPSFQMSFSAVIAIVALHSAEPVRQWFARREEGFISAILRHGAILLVTGVVIELALMPIGLFHFHRAGLYGALANVVAIPLTTFVSMPLIGLALLLDIAGLGAPAWWAAGKSLELLLWLAHVTAAQPGSVALLPAMSAGPFLVFVSGALWLALWSGRVRLWGLVPVLIGVAGIVLVKPADVLISGDGRNVGITGEGGELLVLRQGRGDYVRDNLLEIAGMDGEVRTIDEWPGAECNRDFCSLVLIREGRRTRLLISRGRDIVEEFPLAAACERADLVIADRRLPWTCRPRWLKADRRMLATSGGLALDLAERTVTSVADTQGHHGWYRWPEPGDRRSRASAPSPELPSATSPAGGGPGHQ